MNWKATLTEATQLVRRCLPDITGRTIAFVLESELPPAMRLGRSFGYTHSSLALQIWGPAHVHTLAAVISDLNMARKMPARELETAVRSVCLHESIHWVVMPGFGVAGAMEATEENQRCHHGPDFLRALAHIYLRASRLGPVPSWSLMISGVHPEPQHPARYVRALVSESAVWHGRSLNDILSTRPPAEFTKVFLEDLAAERERRDERERRYGDAMLSIMVGDNRRDQSGPSKIPVSRPRPFTPIGLPTLFPVGVPMLLS